MLRDNCHELGPPTLAGVGWEGMGGEGGGVRWWGGSSLINTQSQIQK